MTQAWYRVASMGFGYLSAVLIAAVVLLSLHKCWGDYALWRRVRRALPQAGSAGMLRVMASGGSRRLSPGQEIRVPYEGTLGSALSCDVCIPYRKVHMRSAFFWMENGELHMVPLHSDGFLVDDVLLEPGDEAVLLDGAVLSVGELRMVLRLYRHSGVRAVETPAEPYVTRARRDKAQQGRGEGIGAPGRGEIRREKKRWEKKLNQNEVREAKEAAARRKKTRR